MKVGLKHNSETCDITFGDKVVGGWNNDANQDYPEDLVWHRDIGGFADKMFEAGITEAIEALESEHAPHSAYTAEHWAKWLRKVYEL